MKDVVIADPYYMHENNVCGEAGRTIMKNYHAKFMVANKGKDYLLVPYHPL